MSRQLFKYNSKIGYTFIENLKARVNHESGGYLIRTNNMGFRSDIDFKCKKSSQKRVLIFGDSFTAGDGVSNGKRFSDLAQKTLQNYEIYNFGLPGTGTDQQYLIFKELVKGKIEYDAIILALQVENIRRVNSKYRQYVTEDGELKTMAKPYFNIEGCKKLKLNHIPVPKNSFKIADIPAQERKFIDTGGRSKEFRHFVNKLGPRVKLFLQKLSKYQPLPEYNKESNPDWKLMKTIILNWIQEAKMPFMIFLLPTYHYIEELAKPKYYQCRFLSLINDEPNVFLLDPLPELVKYSKQERRKFRFEKDIHPTPLLHEVLSDLLVHQIKVL